MIQFVYLLNENQKNNLQGQLVEPDWYFNPIKDCMNNWIISEEEVNNSIYPENDWIRNLPKIEWCIPPQPPPPNPFS